MLDNEVWRVISRYNGAYEVSNLGRVKSIRTLKTGKIEKILKPYLNPNGYANVSLYKDGKQEIRQVHILVAEAFLQKPFGDNLEIKHKNTKDKYNNCVSNLEYATRKEINEAANKAVTKHGKYLTSIYRIWDGMIQRCTNPNNPRYEDYGGRGIKVCEEWMNFENFYIDMGDRPKDMSLDRINNDGNYCKENCKWSTRMEQTNNMRNNVMLTYNGETLTTAQWSRKLEIPVGTIRTRLYRGWSVERILGTDM